MSLFSQPNWCWLTVSQFYFFNPPAPLPIFGLAQSKIDLETLVSFQIPLN